MVTLICNVDGKPEPNVSWTRNGFSLNTNENADVAISDDQKTPTKVEKHLLVVVVVVFFPCFIEKWIHLIAVKSYRFLSLFIFIHLLVTDALQSFAIHVKFSNLCHPRSFSA